MPESYSCGFCLHLVENVEICPDRCVRCEMAICNLCGTWLKERDGISAKFCYGCGTVNPFTIAQFSKTTSLSCCYMERNWQQRNLGKDCEIYSVATGWKNSQDKKAGVPKSSWIVKGDEDVRELTDEEKLFLGI